MHLGLRLAALALLASAALWPRPRGRTTWESTAELSRAGAQGSDAGRTRGVHGAQAVTASARLASGPRTAKLVMAVADDQNVTD